MTASPARIGVAGAGAIGGWVAARLALGGNAVSLLTRSATPKRVSLTISEAGHDQTVEVCASADAAELGPQDVLVIAVKAPALPSLAPRLAPMIGPDTLIVPMMNGVPWWFVDGAPLAAVDPGGAIAAAVPIDRVIGCVVHAACSRPAPGHIRVTHADRLIIGEPAGGPSARVERFCALVSAAGIRAEASADIRRAIWYKLWGNATINPISAQVRLTCDLILAHPHWRAMMLAGMAELAAVGAAIGCPISDSGEARMVVTARLGAFRTSMLQDVEAGRPIELDALLGAPIEIARRHGIATSTLDRIYRETLLAVG